MDCASTPVLFCLWKGALNVHGTIRQWGPDFMPMAPISQANRKPHLIALSSRDDSIQNWFSKSFVLI